MAEERKGVYMEFLLLTGISGAGRTQASKFLEDLGYFCIDNLPVPLLPGLKKFYLTDTGKPDKVALVIDIRSGNFYSDFISFVQEMKEEAAVKTEVLFMDCGDEKILNRYKELKRFHPWARDGIDNKQALLLEREALAPIRRAADYIVDTTEMSIWDLKREMAELFGKGRRENGIRVEVISFGYKYGIPAACDLVLDVRFLPNPYYEKELRLLTGSDAPVREYVLLQESAGVFLDRLFELLKMLLPLYQNEGKELLVVGIGCTGGQHRSVVIAEEIGKRISTLGYGTSVSHRDLKKAKR